MTAAEYIALAKIMGPAGAAIVLALGVLVTLYMRNRSGNGNGNGKPNGPPSRPEYANDINAVKDQIKRVETQLHARLKEGRAEVQALRGEVQGINEDVSAIKAKVDLLVDGKLKS